MLLVEAHYYYSVYGGTCIPKTLFLTKLKKASNKVNYYTCNRITENMINDDIRDATCEIADLIYSQEKLKEKVLSSDEKIKASETVGPHSITYINKTSFQEKKILTDTELEYNCYQICIRHLSHLGLMYRGY